MTEKIFMWASAHQPTKEQLVDLTSQGKVIYLKEINLQLFNKITNLKIDSNLYRLAQELIATTVAQNLPEEKCILVQPAGSPAFQYTLGEINTFNIVSAYISPAPGGRPTIEIVYSFSERVSQDIPQEDGTVKKVSIFKHMGWV
jgi:hypothetical protein